MPSTEWACNALPPVSLPTNTAAAVTTNPPRQSQYKDSEDSENDERDSDSEDYDEPRVGDDEDAASAFEPPCRSEPPRRSPSHRSPRGTSRAGK